MQITLTPLELDHVDRARGEISRSTWGRAIIREALLAKQKEARK